MEDPFLRQDLACERRNPRIQTAHIRMADHIFDAAAIEQALQHHELAWIVGLRKADQIHSTSVSLLFHIPRRTLHLWSFGDLYATLFSWPTGDG